jgi:hypothetical protein
MGATRISLPIDSGARKAVRCATRRPTRLRCLDWALPTGSLVGLFGLFVGVQFVVLFGGADHVLRTTGLTYAEYARSGFWQLLVVTVLAMVAVPATTLPPVGSWLGAGAPACARPAMANAATRGVRWNRFMARAAS